MFQTAHSLHTNLWIEEWRQFMSADTDELSPNLRARLIDPLREGDPVFANLLCHELIVFANLNLALRAIISLQPSKRRILQCELLFYLCKCPAPQCRIYIASFLPALLWMEWLLGCRTAAAKGKDRGEGSSDDSAASDELEEDLSALAIALLAAYQQDFGINPIHPTIRIFPFRRPSIYHDGSVPTDAQLEAYPYNVKSAELIGEPHLDLAEPLAKFDAYTRFPITYRLCRFFQDFLNEMQETVLISYLFLLERFASLGTSLISTDLQQKVQNGEAFKMVVHRERTRTDRSATSDLVLGMSTLSFSRSLLDLLEEESSDISPNGPLICESIVQLSSVFLFSPSPSDTPFVHRYPIQEELLNLWADALPFYIHRYPVMADLIKRQLLRRARTEAFPRAILALS